MRFKRMFLGAVAASGLALTSYAQAPKGDADPYRNAQLSSERRAADLLGRMTLDEKVAMLSGSGWMESTGIPRLGIPAIKMADGPMGIRIWTGSSAETSVEGMVRTFTSTAFPAGIDIAASWDPALANEEGTAIGQEVLSVGRDMILGPTVNIQRAPLWGRNFEGYGEDPFLASQIAVGYIRGIQSQNVIASVKHFAVNNQEFERHRIDVLVDERALHEIYFPAFEKAVTDGHVWTVMSSYNKINGVYAAENPLLKQELYDHLGFKGFVISDWGSTYSTAATVNAGMDLEMPGGAPMHRWLAGDRTKEAGNDGGYLVPEKVLAQLRDGAISTAAIDNNVKRILTVIFESGLFDKPHTETKPIDTPAQRAIARKAAAEGIVLLKNDKKVLPLNVGQLHSIAVIGPNAKTAQIGGGGSGLVFAKDVVSPLDGIWKRAGNVSVRFALGASMPGEESGVATPEARQRLKDEAVEIARSSDVAIIFVGYSWKLETEGKDRESMNLPAGQDDLIRAVAAVNKQTIVVFNSGGPVEISQWVNEVPGLIDAWFPGEEGGNAIADVLFGEVNPSGKLPFTFIRKLEDSPSYANYPGTNLQVKYAEGIYVGYRFFDKHPNVEPMFPFGYGLSYTSFALSELSVPKTMTINGNMLITATVRNTGNRRGATVVQLYLGNPNSKVDRPVRELKGFERVELEPGERRQVTFKLTKDSVSYYSVSEHAWVADPGQFTVSVGYSSRDLPLQGGFTLAKGSR